MFKVMHWVRALIPFLGFFYTRAHGLPYKIDM
jgi:hypothetical protein